MASRASNKVKRAVLAYSGGLDTSIIIPWLRENYGCEVIAMVGDVGQGDDYEAVRKKALTSGATQVFVEDLREEFITGYRLEGAPGGRRLRRQVSAGNFAGAAGAGQAAGGGGAATAAPTPWRTAAPARATTRCGSRWLTRRWRRICG